MAQNKEKPVWSFEKEGFCVAVWANQSNGRVWMNTTITRSYKKKDGDQWNKKSSWLRDELPVVRVLADMAHEWIWKHEPAEPDQEKMSNG